MATIPCDVMDVVDDVACRRCQAEEHEGERCIGDCCAIQKFPSKNQGSQDEAVFHPLPRTYQRDQSEHRRQSRSSHNLVASMLKVRGAKASHWRRHRPIEQRLDVGRPPFGPQGGKPEDNRRPETPRDHASTTRVGGFQILRGRQGQAVLLQQVPSAIGSRS